MNSIASNNAANTVVWCKPSQPHILPPFYDALHIRNGHLVTLLPWTMMMFYKIFGMLCWKMAEDCVLNSLT